MEKSNIQLHTKEYSTKLTLCQVYNPQSFVIPACAIGAPHRRDRLWVVAHASDDGLNRNDSPSGGLQGEQSRESLRHTGQPDRIGGNERPDWHEDWYEVAAKFCRMDARIPNRVDRLKSLGNSIVPQVAYEVIKAMLNERI